MDVDSIIMDVSGRSLEYRYCGHRDVSLRQELGELIDGVQQNKRLKDKLRWWSEACKQDAKWMHHYVYFLEHHYDTAAGLKLDSLRGRDAEKVKALAEACEGLGFTVFLSTFSRRDFCEYESDDSDDEDDDSDDEDEDEDEEETRLTHVFDLSGTSLVGNIRVEPKHMLQDSYFEDLMPNLGQYHRVTINEDIGETDWYHGAALVILPQDIIPDFLISPYVDPRPVPEEWFLADEPPIESDFSPTLVDVINILANNMDQDAPHHFRAVDLSRFCFRALHEYNIEVDDDLVCAIIEVAERMRWPGLFMLAFPKLQGRCPDGMMRVASRMMRNNGFSWQLMTAFGKYLEKYRTIHERYFFLRDLLRPSEPRFQKLPNRVEKDFGKWAQERILGILQTAPRIYVEDGEAMGCMIEEREIWGGLPTSPVYTVIEHNLSNTPAMVAFLNKFYAAALSGKVPIETSLETYTRIASQVVENFSILHDPFDVIHNLHTTTPPRHGDRASSSATAAPVEQVENHPLAAVPRGAAPPPPDTPRRPYTRGTPPPISARAFDLFLQNLRTEGLSHLVGAVANTINRELPAIRYEELCDRLVPVLHALTMARIALDANSAAAPDLSAIDTAYWAAIGCIGSRAKPAAARAGGPPAAAGRSGSVMSNAQSDREYLAGLDLDLVNTIVAHFLEGRRGETGGRSDGAC